MAKRNKPIAVFFAFFLALSFSSQSLAISANDIREVAPIGHTTGIKMLTDGIIVIGITAVETSEGIKNPSAEAGVLQGDIIKKVNSKKTKTNEEFQKEVRSCKGQVIKLEIERNQSPINVQVTPVKDKEGVYKIGIWIRDSMAGIGTITFYDPKHRVFGALGHGICDTETNVLIPFGSGSVMESSIADVKKGTAGSPGELIGNYNLEKDFGILNGNTESGIFGQVLDDSDFKNLKLIPVAKREEVKEGPAVILSNVEGNKVSEYQIEIIKIYPDDASETKNMMIKVTDPKLIEKTGGIVQGMSGSPILQNGKLVGAVTHVLVNDPQKGYGILIEKMITTAFDKIYKDVA